MKKGFDAGPIALENLLFHQRGSSVQRVTSPQPTCFMALHEMTRNMNTIAGVVNDPVNPNNGGEILSVSKSSSFYFCPDISCPSPPPQPLIAAFASKEKKKEKTNPCFASIFSLTFHNLQDLLSPPLHSPYLSTPFPASSFTLLHLRRSRGTGRSSLCASLGGCLLACDPSCASAWLTGWGSTPGRWCIGRARRRCGYAGA